MLRHGHRPFSTSKKSSHQSSETTLRETCSRKHQAFALASCIDCLACSLRQGMDNRHATDRTSAKPPLELANTATSPGRLQAAPVTLSRGVKTLVRWLPIGAKCQDTTNKALLDMNIRSVRHPCKQFTHWKANMTVLASVSSSCSCWHLPAAAA